MPDSSRDKPLRDWDCVEEFVELHCCEDGKVVHNVASADIATEVSGTMESCSDDMSSLVANN